MKRYLLGFAAILLTITTTAFVVHKTKAQVPQTDVWFDFNGTPTEVNDDTKYSLDADNVPDCSTTVAYRCEIKAPVQAGSSPAMPDLAHISATRYKAAP